MTPGSSLQPDRRVLGATIEQWALVTALPLNQAVNSALFTVVGPFRAGFALNYAVLGVVLASYGLARFFMDIPAGVLVRRAPLRTVLILALVANLAASLAPLRATAVWHIVLARAVQGSSSSITQAAILAWLIIGARAANRGRVMALSESLFSVVGLTVPLATGALAAYLGWRAAFTTGSIAAALACLAILLGTRAASAPSTTAPGRDSGPGEASVAAALAAGGGLLIAGYLLAFIAAFSRFGMLSTLLPVIGADVIGLSPVQVGFGQTLANLAAIVVVMIGGWAGDRFGRGRLAVPGVMLLLLCQLTIFAAGDPRLYYAVAIAQGAASLMNSLPTSLVGDSLPPHLRSIGVVGYRLVVDAAVLTAPVVVGAVSDWRGFDAAKILIMSVTALVAVLVWRTARRRPIASPGEAGVAISR